MLGRVGHVRRRREHGDMADEARGTAPLERRKALSHARFEAPRATLDLITERREVSERFGVSEQPLRGVEEEGVELV